MYKFRLDSYHSPGTIFIGAMSEKEYVSLQEYQMKLIASHLSNHRTFQTSSASTRPQAMPTTGLRPK